jgi:CPA2 family monovalent cation:H+ antiporter-2
MLAAGASADVLIELGVVLLVLAVIGRFAGRIGVPSVPLYLLAGLAMGEGGLIPLDASDDFIRIGADVGVVLLLLLLGLEYSGSELRDGLRSHWPSGLVDLASAVPGAVAGLVLGWGATATIVLAGVTYVSSSGIIAKLLGDLDRIANRETPVVLSILVMEDLAMAMFLPVLGVLLAGSGIVEGTLQIAGALALVAVALVVSIHFGSHVSRLVWSRSREVLLLTILGLTFLVAGFAEEVHVSSAVGAFLIGVALSGTVAEDGRELVEPLRDVFGGLFFVFFGLQVDPGSLGPALVPAALIGIASVITKVGTGWWSAGRAGIGRRGRLRAGLSLVPRGEFSIVIAGLGVAEGLHVDLGPLSAAYVLIMAIVGSMLMRFADEVPLRPPPPTTPVGSIG